MKQITGQTDGKFTKKTSGRGQQQQTSMPPQRTSSLWWASSYFDNFLDRYFSIDTNMFSNWISKLQHIKIVKFVNEGVSKNAVRLFHIFSCQNSCGSVKRKWTKSCRNYLQCGRCGIAVLCGGIFVDASEGKIKKHFTKHWGGEKMCRTSYFGFDVSTN